MKWTGTDEDRINATDRFIRTGDYRVPDSGSNEPKRAVGTIDSAEEAYRARNGQNSGLGGSGRTDAGRDQGDLYDRNRARLAERIRRSVIAVAGLSEADYKALHLDPERGRKTKELYGDVKFSKKSSEVRLTIDEIVAAAESQKTWKDWYDRHAAVLDDVFGSDSKLFQQILSATSQAASVKANVGLALKAYRQLMSIV